MFFDHISGKIVMSDYYPQCSDGEIIVMGESGLVCQPQKRAEVACQQEQWLDAAFTFALMCAGIASLVMAFSFWRRESKS